MKLLKADHSRRLEIPGVPGLVRRPVDIDQTQTGFANLRTLRIYRFDPGSVINGHAEEDEVLIVVLGGSIELTMTSFEEVGPFVLSAANAASSCTCAAYLPPHAAYRLVPQSEADVAYVRATPNRGRVPKVFTSHPSPLADGTTVLLAETTYAERLRMRLVQVEAREHDLKFEPLNESARDNEAVMHVRISPNKTMRMKAEGSPPLELRDWDSASIARNERAFLHITSGSSALALVVFAV